MLSIKKSQSSFLVVMCILFFLGNWLKITVHKIFNYPYIEPNGNFIGDSTQWADYYISSIVITSSLIFFNVFVTFIPKVKNTYLDNISANKISADKVGIIFLLIIYLLNWKFGFYRIGVSREMYLPFGLDAPVSFLVFIGAPIYLSIIATSLIIKKKRLTKSILFLVAIMSLIASTTIYSRASALLIMLPILFGLNKTAKSIGLNKSSLELVLLATGGTLIISIFVVSIIRSYVYSGDLSSERLGFYLLESFGLVFDRWIGAEAIMTAVTSQPSTNLFFFMLQENPSVGVDGIYQKLSDSHYVYTEGMTFLTLPGAFGLLTFSGNFALIFVGVFIICVIGLIVEQFVKKNFKRQHALELLISTNLAYHFSQMIFAYLFIPFIVQLILLLIFTKLCFVAASTNYMRKKSTFEK